MGQESFKALPSFKFGFREIWNYKQSSWDWFTTLQKMPIYGNIQQVTVANMVLTKPDNGNRKDSNDYM